MFGYRSDKIISFLNRTLAKKAWSELPWILSHCNEVIMHIKIKKGLDIPIKGKPFGPVRSIETNGQRVTPKLIALDLKSFENVKFKILCNVGEAVKIGQPLAEDKTTPSRMFVSPAAGIIKDIRRGLKRRLLSIVIEVAEQEDSIEHPKINIVNSSKEEIVEWLKAAGLFAHIKQRPFGVLANPNLIPRCIFVKAIESEPLTPSAEMQVEGHEEDFQSGLDVLSRLTFGPVHLVYRKGTSCRAFIESKNVERHTAEGPHPIGTHSVHIHFISPIYQAEEIIWTLNVHDVICIGHLLTKGKYFTDRIISIAGPGVLPDRIGFFKARAGYPIESLVAGRVDKANPSRLISGDVLTGDRVEIDEFLGLNHFAFSVFPENKDREFLHFFRLGLDKFSATKTYLSGHLNNSERLYNFTTNQHGEKRGFVVNSPYEQVMPMQIPTMQLIKAILAEDYELAEEMGLLEVEPEDFALATFVCPSKIEMSEIVKIGLKEHAVQVLS